MSLEGEDTWTAVSLALMANIGRDHWIRHARNWVDACAHKAKQL
jgi:hypothetical protein